MPHVAAWLAIAALLIGSLLRPAPLYAQAATTQHAGATAPSRLQIEARDGALHLSFQSDAAQGGIAPASAPVASTKSYGGYLLPMQTLLVELPPDASAPTASAAVAVQGLSSSPFAGTLMPAPVHTPPALDYVPTPTNTPYVEPALPTAPVFVIAEGWQRNRHLAVVGFSELYQDPASGEVRQVESMAASVAGAQVVTEDALLAEALANPDNAALFAPLSTLQDVPGPTNPLANTNALKLLVGHAGIQQISGQQLADAGLASPKASKVRVFYLGQEVPLHIIDHNGNDVVNSDDYLRFYAPTAGDAINPAGVYWLTTGTVDGLRMGERAVAPAGAPARTTAYEVGRYAQNSHYTTELAGADGDNWFQADLRAIDAEAGHSVTFPHQLPLGGALPTLLQVNLTAYSIGKIGTEVAHQLRVEASGFSTTNSWTSRLTGPAPFDNTVVDFSLATANDKWTLTLLPGDGGRAVKLDAIDYWLPVQLNFGGKGAVFEGIEGEWRYQLTNTPVGLPSGRALYDITDPARPQRLTIPGGADIQFQDGPQRHRYLFLGEGTLFTPTIETRAPVNFNTSGAAHTIYIAPKVFHDELQPLVDLRQSQGYQVRMVDVQSIYDAWSYGMVDPKAIRSFLRFAAAHWSPAPIAAILVGDSTADPLNYLGEGNPDVIPAYVANVDPWIKYVPCDSCFGQLHGDDPAGDYLVDIWIGRFPVIDESELTIVVDKIISYETNPEKLAVWRATSLQIADDDVRPDNTVDSAGPFVGSAEHIISLLPPAVRHLRNYFSAATSFDAIPDDAVIYVRDGQPVYWKETLLGLRDWFVADADEALQRSIRMMSGGVGLVTFTGHSNHWQWARITKDGEENRWIFGLVEVLSLHNRSRPFITLSMTCYTSQFNQTAPRHFTLDERLFLHGGGGAISTWGPTGFSIVPAHDTLQEGFHGLLWKSPPQQAKLGALVKAGYEAVFAGGVNLDVNKTFALFGDPLTPARVTEVDTFVYMPHVERAPDPAR